MLFVPPPLLPYHFNTRSLLSLSYLISQGQPRNLYCEKRKAFVCVHYYITVWQKEIGYVKCGLV